MYKIGGLITLFLIFTIITVAFYPKNRDLKIIKVKSSNEFYVDYNFNNKADEDELVELCAVRGFVKGIKTPFTKELESAKLNYLADEFARNELLNKSVALKFDDKKQLVTIYYENKDYSELLLKSGLGLINESFPNPSYKNPGKSMITQRLKEAEKLNLTAYNPFSKRIHSLSCQFSNLNGNVQILPQKLAPKDSKLCKHCHLSKVIAHTKFPRIESEKYAPAYSDKSIELYLSDFTKYYYPSKKCVTTSCQSLLREINNSKSEIDFAIYGVSNQPAIVDALKKANERGVKIRWVYDLDNKGKNIYQDTLPLTKILKNNCADQSILDEPGKFSNIIMHNKFFIFDNKTVWAGSANISETDMSGFNANSVLLLKSEKIAQIYKQEFEQMYNGAFHKQKPSVDKAEKIRIENTFVSVYFSPQNRSVENVIIPLVKNAKNYIYLPVFVITHKNLVNELISANNRGVDVRIIIDATGAANRYSPVKQMRDAGIKIKTENRPGKMHMKSLLIDDKYCIVGSMNFSRAGESYNDENMILLENPSLTMAFKKHFLYLWSSIPEKWLYKNPRAESVESINSCFDGIDNDHDGKIDKEDSGCNFHRRTSQ